MSDTDTQNIDAIFDLAADPTPSTPSSTPPQANNSETNTPTTPSTPAESDQSNAEASSADKGGALYPNVLRTLKASEAGEGNPEGTLTIGEFAGHLTVEAIKAGGTINDIVKDAAIYTGVKAARHPLPVVLVFADDVDASDPNNQKLAKVYLPVAEATEVYKNRPARGEGSSAASSKKDQEGLLLDAAKRAISLANITKRFNRVSEQKAKAEKLLAKSHGWLANYYKATDADLTEITDPNTNETRTETLDEASKRLLNAAIADKAAEIEEQEAAKAESEKSDIE